MTIKANELRIGNWVYGSSGKKLIKIDYIKFDRIGMRLIGEGYAGLISESYEETIAFSKPIPLTEEILLKCGFEKESDAYTYKYFELSYDFYCAVNSCEYTIGEKINSVHQLQNLYFALTGEELKINL